LLEAAGFAQAISTVTPERRVQFSLRYSFYPELPFRENSSDVSVVKIFAAKSF
jgi:hypothetical protein